MTELMTLLFDYAKDADFTCRLNTREYRELTDLTGRLSCRLRQSLVNDVWDTLEKYQDALAQQRDLELEAMFLSALALAKEL